MALQTAASTLRLQRSFSTGADEVRRGFSIRGIAVEVKPLGRKGKVPRSFCASSGSGDSAKCNGGSSKGKKGSVPSSNYVVPLDKSFSSSNSSCITRPLVEILRDLNKRIPDNIINPLSSTDHGSDSDADQPSTFIPWYCYAIAINRIVNTSY